MKKIDNLPLVSIIIPTKNSSSTLETVLKSVRRQTYPNIEIIVVDNYSKDDTVLIAKKYGARLYMKGPERSVQRNYGANKTTGKYLVFLDSDIELSSNVIAECVDLAKKGFKVITFPEVIVGEGFWTKCRALEAQCYLGDDVVEAPRFYEKEVFLRLGGFDVKLNGPEDWELRERAIKNGYKIGRNKSLTFHHEGKVNPLKRIRKKCYYAKTMYEYLKKHPCEWKRQFPLMRKCYWRNWRLLIRDPLHTLGFICLKLGETLAIGITMIIYILEAKFKWRTK